MSAHSLTTATVVEPNALPRKVDEAELIRLLDEYVSAISRFAVAKRFLPTTEVAIVIGTETSPLSLTLRTRVLEWYVQLFRQLVADYGGAFSCDAALELVGLLGITEAPLESNERTKLEDVLKALGHFNLPFSLNTKETTLL